MAKKVSKTANSAENVPNSELIQIADPKSKNFIEVITALTAARSIYRNGSFSEDERQAISHNLHSHYSEAELYTKNAELFANREKSEFLENAETTEENLKEIAPHTKNKANSAVLPKINAQLMQNS